MKVAIDATIVNTTTPSGLGVYSRNLVNAMARLHPDCEVWSGEDVGYALPPAAIHRAQQGLALLGDRRYLTRPLWLNTVFPRELARVGVDVVLSTSPAGIAGWRGPHVILVHDLIPLRFPVDAPWPSRVNFRYRMPRVLRHASALLADSEATRQDIVKMIGVPAEKIHVIHAGYDRDHFHRDVDLSPLGTYGLGVGDYLLYVGNASPRKNLERLIRGYARVASRLARKLVLVGKHRPAERRTLRALARREGVDSQVVFLDYVPYRDLPALYRGAAAFVYVSLYEGFGLPPLEAMACGTPVVVADATSLPEVVGEAGILVDPRKEEAIAAGLAKVASDAGLRRALAEAGLRRARHFSWEASARRSLSVLHAVVAGETHGL